jgi:germination protein M
MYKIILSLGGKVMRKKWISATCAALLMPFALTGCLFGPEQKTNGPIDPPPGSAKKLDAQAVTAKDKKQESLQQDSKTQKKEKGTELYFLTDSGYVVPYALPVPNSKAKAKEMLKYMVKGGPAETLLPKGFTPALPQGTQIKAIDLNDGTATVDFSKAFLGYDEKREEQILEAITWTLTELPNVNQVNVWVEGKPLELMPKKKTTAQKLTRGRGINVEVTEGTDLVRSMPVTLYFLGQTSDNTVYYVPVTRMVNRTDRLAETVLKELIKGPRQESGLSGALDTDTEVHRAEVNGDLVTADFGDGLLQYNGQRSASRDALNAIVLSLTENTHAKKVKITVNSKPASIAQGEKANTAGEPVMRPEFVNPAGL